MNLYISKMIDHYILDDGRIWSVPKAKFVKKVPADGVPGPCPDEHGKNSLAGLIGCLEFYHYAKGELEGMPIDVISQDEYDDLLKPVEETEEVVEAEVETEPDTDSDE